MNNTTTECFLILKEMNNICICIKDILIYYGHSAGSKLIFSSKVGETHSYYHDNFGYNIQDKINKNLYYPIIIGFNDNFIDIIDLRNDKLNKILE